MDGFAENVPRLLRSIVGFLMLARRDLSAGTSRNGRKTGYLYSGMQNCRGLRIGQMTMGTAETTLQIV